MSHPSTASSRVLTIALLWLACGIPGNVAEEAPPLPQLRHLCWDRQRNNSRAHVRCFSGRRCRCSTGCQDVWRDKVPYVLEALGLRPGSGEIYEFGVFDGASLRDLGRQFPGIRIWGFDSFQGFPSEPQDVQQIDFRPGHYSTTVSLPDLVAELGGPSRLGLIAGFFEDSLVPGLREARGMREALYIHVDADLYTGSYQALDWAFESALARPGTLIGYDDWWVNPCSHGGENLHPLATGEGRAHREIALKYRVRFRCVAGSCRYLPEEAVCESAWGALFVVEAIGVESLDAAEEGAIPSHGFEMSREQVQLWKNANRLCQNHMQSPYHWLYAPT